MHRAPSGRADVEVALSQRVGPREVVSAGLLLASVCAFAALGAQTPVGPPPGYAKQDTMVPMRDHVRLHVAIYTPTQALGPLPIMLLRTPYGIDYYGAMFESYLKELAADQYIFVFEDLRGRHESEGQFVMLLPARDRHDPTAIDESTGLVRHGRLAGQAFRRTTTAASGSWGFLRRVDDGHDNDRPAPGRQSRLLQASPSDMFIGDDFHHNGAFRLSYGFEYAATMESGKGQYSLRVRPVRYLRRYLCSALCRTSTRSICTARSRRGKISNHPNYDAFWTPGGIAVPGSGHRAHAERCRMVGPGGLRRPRHHLPDAGEAHW